MLCFDGVERICCLLMVCFDGVEWIALCFDGVERMCSVLQVISNALGVWGLELVLFNSREYQQLQINPM